MGCDGPLHSGGGADGSWGVINLFTHGWSRWLSGCDLPLNSLGGADGSWGVMDFFSHVVEPMALGV